MLVIRRLSSLSLFIGLFDFLNLFLRELDRVESKLPGNIAHSFSIGGEVRHGLDCLETDRLILLRVIDVGIGLRIILRPILVDELTINLSELLYFLKELEMLLLRHALVTRRNCGLDLVSELGPAVDR